MPADPYLLPNGTLRNKLGITDPAKLHAAEADLVAFRLALLPVSFQSVDYSLPGLQAIHRFLFEPLYAWAGELRSVPLAKREFEEGGRLTQFASPETIREKADRVFSLLQAKNRLRDTNRSDFAAGCASFLAGINAVHPFREGNGRAQRALLALLARDAGHPLNLTSVSRERMIQASIDAAAGNLGKMLRIMQEAVDPGLAASMRRAVQFLESHHFDWNDFYIATAIPGQSYSAIFAGRSGNDCMLRVGDSTIIIADGRDIPQTARPNDRITFIAGRWPSTEEDKSHP